MDVRAQVSSATTDVVRLRLLHAPRLSLADGSGHPLQRKDAALLAILVLDGPTPRGRVAGLLWPQADDEGARNNLRQRLFRLRRLAGRDLVEQSHVLALAPRIEHDLDGLESALLADHAAMPGEVLGGYDFGDSIELADWIDGARQQWRAARRDVLAEIAARLEGERRIAEALPYADRLAREEPLLEHAHRRVMRLHYRRGDRSAALAAYQRFRAALDMQIGETPSRETQELAALIEAADALPVAALQPQPPVPVAVLRPPRLVGREREQQAVAQGWEAGWPVLVTGEPGIGKSRFLADFAARRGAVVLIGCRPGDERQPFAPLTRLVRSLVAAQPAAPLAESLRGELARFAPELGSVAENRPEPAQLAQALQALIERCGSAGVVVDDLQFADEATLELLPVLVGAVPGPTRWLFGARAAELPPALRRWLAGSERRALRGVELAALSRGQVGELLASLGLAHFDAERWASALHRHTGGNPLFVLETLRALLADGPIPASPADASVLPLPGELRTLIERRLQQLTPLALKLARVAAVAGQDFGAELAAAVLQLHPLDLTEAWQELEAAQVLRDNGFAHDLIHDAVRRSVPPAIARPMHLRVAEFLTVHGDMPARLAVHWQAAGVHLEAARQFREAARRSERLSSVALLAEQLQQSADAFEHAGDAAGRDEALRELAGVYTRRYELASARAIAERLLASADTPQARALALDRLIDQLNVARQDQRVEPLAREMLAIGQMLERPWLQFNASRKLALALAHRQCFDEALAVFATQREFAEANAHEWNVHVFDSDLGYVLELAGESEAALAQWQRVAETAVAAGNHFAGYAARRNRAMALAWQGEPEAARAAFEEALQAASPIDGFDALANPREACRYAALLRDAGRLADALALLERAVRLMSADGPSFWLAWAQDQLAATWLQLGQPTRCAPLLAAPLDDLVPEARVSRRIMQLRLALAQGRRGDELAVRALEASADALCPARWRALAAIWHAVVDAGQEREASIATLAALAATAQPEGVRLHAALRLAELRASDASAGPPRITAALWPALARATPAGLSRGETLLALYRALAGHDAGAAAAVLQLAVNWLRHLALPQVAPEFHDSFLHRHPQHSELLAASTRLCLPR